MIKAVIFDFYGVLYVNHGLNKGLIAYVEAELRPKFKIGLLSNIELSVLGNYFESAELGSLFDAVALSGDIDVAKPQAGAYQNICQKLGIDPSEALMIDDLRENCAGAKMTGLQAIQYKNLDELKNLLKNA